MSVHLNEIAVSKPHKVLVQRYTVSMGYAALAIEGFHVQSF